jgi:uncharacterized protein with HEPN domain
MQRDYRVYLEDILEAAAKIREYTKELSQSKFSADSKTVDAVARNLEIIGEAVKHVPDEVRSKYPEAEWKRIAGLRDILVHEYFGIDLEIIWDIVQNKLPVLEKQIQRVVEDLDEP